MTPKLRKVYKCPACGFQIYNRRVTKCEKCHQPLPADLLFSTTEVAALNTQYESSKKARDAQADRDSAAGDSGGSSADIYFGGIDIGGGD